MTFEKNIMPFPLLHYLQNDVFALHTTSSPYWYGSINMKLIEMIKQVKHIPSGVVYENRKEAKLMMGHSNYNKAIRNGQMLFVSTYAPNEIVFN